MITLIIVTTITIIGLLYLKVLIDKINNNNNGLT